jgi:hypothetical protein
LFVKNSSWQSKRPLQHTSVSFYGECVKIYEDFAQNFGHERTGSCISTTRRFTLPFYQGHFKKEQHYCRPPHSLLASPVLPPPPLRLFLFLRLKIKLTGTVEVTEEEPQTVLNTARELDSQDAFKKWQNRWERYILRKHRRGLLREWLWPVGQNFVFDQMSVPVMEFMTLTLES